MQDTLIPPPSGGAYTRKNKVSFGKISERKGSRIGLYGAAGVGKTTLAATTKGNKVFIDLDDSLPVLQSQLTPDQLKTISILKVSTWSELIENLRMDGWDGIDSIIIDTVTKAEELCAAYTLQTVPNGKEFVRRLDDYGYGKGYNYLYDNFLPLLATLDTHCAAGRNVILIMHDCTTTVPNPEGDDYLRYEPRLSSPASGKSSIRYRVREWTDSLLFLGYKRTVIEGKGKATLNKRSLIPTEQPYCMAKSRNFSQILDVELSSNALNQFLKI